LLDRSVVYWAIPTIPKFEIRPTMGRRGNFRLREKKKPICDTKQPPIAI
jgi:hypothetical protein